MALKISRESKFALLCLSPFFIFLSIFILYPLGASFYYTFTDLSLRTLEYSFVGLRNWAYMISDPVFITSLWHTLYFFGLTTIIAVPAGLGTALLLSQEFKGNTFGRVLLLLPWATPPIVVSLIFWWIFNSAYGIVNWLLKTLGLIPAAISFFSTPFLVLNILALFFCWKVFTLYGLLFLSALQNVPKEIVESVKIYKAGVLSRFKYVIWPHIKGIFVINCILNAILSLLYSFDIVISITKGGPGTESYVLTFYSYLTTFWYLNAGYGATLAYVVTLIGLVFAFTALRWYKVV
ncbi:sugar ABC transporter permease [Candidatus Hecatella orcuttiae]|uniref:carbohydrate ABC transporter permease n=1 Tax=Candidatus Hecatella orcuttiae TaxID=1935119 RepID=UPI0028680EEE|nr:sugar ABC transporter permease [Candidatus Hecatella orcuttiae]